MDHSVPRDCIPMIYAALSGPWRFTGGQANRSPAAQKGAEKTLPARIYWPLAGPTRPLCSGESQGGRHDQAGLVDGSPVCSRPTQSSQLRCRPRI